MNRLWVAFCIAVLCASFAYGQSAGQQAAPNPPSSDEQSAASSQTSVIRGSFPVILPKGIDSKKLKEGDTVICETAAPLRTSIGIIPSGSKVVAHVTQAKARSKGDSESSFALTFDKIEYGKGKETPMKGTLQAVGPSLGGNSGPDTGAASNGVLAGGHGPGGGDSGPGSTPPPTPSNSASAPKSKTILIPTSEGVLGIKNLEMNKDGVLTSSNKEVKLDNGTQLLVRAEIQVSAQ